MSEFLYLSSHFSDSSHSVIHYPYCLEKYRKYRNKGAEFTIYQGQRGKHMTASLSGSTGYTFHKQDTKDGKRHGPGVEEK